MRRSDGKKSKKSKHRFYFSPSLPHGIYYRLGGGVRFHSLDWRSVMTHVNGLLYIHNDNECGRRLRVLYRCGD